MDVNKDPNVVAPSGIQPQYIYSPDQEEEAKAALLYTQHEELEMHPAAHHKTKQEKKIDFLKKIGLYHPKHPAPPEAAPQHLLAADQAMQNYNNQLLQNTKHHKDRLTDGLTPDLQRAIYTGNSDHSIDVLRGGINGASTLGGIADTAASIVPKEENYTQPLLTGKAARGPSKKDTKKAKKAAKDAPAPQDGTAAWLYKRTEDEAKAAADAKAAAEKLQEKEAKKAAKHNKAHHADTTDDVSGPNKKTTNKTTATQSVNTNPLDASASSGPIPPNATPEVQNNKTFANGIQATQNTLQIVQAQVTAVGDTAVGAPELKEFLKAIHTAIDHLKQFLGWLRTADLKTRMGQNKDAGSDQAHVAYHKIKKAIEEIRRLKAMLIPLMIFIGIALLPLLMAILGPLFLIIGAQIHLMIMQAIQNAILHRQQEAPKASDIAIGILMPGAAQFQEFTLMLQLLGPDPQGDPPMEYHYSSDSSGGGDSGTKQSSGSQAAQNLRNYTAESMQKAAYSPTGESRISPEAVATTMAEHPEATAMGINAAVGLIATEACLGSQGLTLNAMSGAFVNGTNNMLNGTRNDPMTVLLGTGAFSAPPQGGQPDPGTAASLLANTQGVGTQYLAAGDDLNTRLAVAAAAFGSAALPATYMGQSGLTIAAATALALTGAVLNDKHSVVHAAGGGGGAGGPSGSGSPGEQQGQAIAMAVAAGSAARKIAKDHGVAEDIAELIAQITKLISLLMQILNAAKGGAKPGGMHMDVMKSSIQQLVAANVGGDAMRQALDDAQKGDAEAMIENLTKSFSAAGMDPGTLAAMGKAVAGDFNIQGIQPQNTGVAYNPLMAA